MKKGNALYRFAGALAVFAAAGLVGCGWAEWPPPGYGYRGTDFKKASGASSRQTHATASAPATTAEREPAPLPPVRGGGEVEVARGDTVYAVSRRYDVSIRAIIDANGLKPPYELAVGQRLTIPAVREHRVEPGETLNGIARHYGISVYDLARTNRIGPPYHIESGQRLILAQAVSPKRAASRSSSPPSSRAASAAVSAAPLPEPGKTESPKTGAQPKSTAKVSRAAPLAPKPKPAPKPARTHTDLTFSASHGFMWPTRGRVLSKFGSVAKGLQNDGINIAARRGAPVRAAKDGVVAYAGNELRGFGNLLLIKHAGGWITAYAHNDTLLVKRGDKVGKGQIIARVGSTGAVTRPQLHFEIRRGKRPIDPQKYLRIAARSS